MKTNLSRPFYQAWQTNSTPFRELGFRQPGQGFSGSAFVIGNRRRRVDENRQRQSVAGNQRDDASRDGGERSPAIHTAKVKKHSVKKIINLHLKKTKTKLLQLSYCV